MGSLIEQKLAGAGYKMLGKDEEIEELILSILKAEDSRYLKAIPFFIYNYNLDIEKIYAQTSKKEIFGQIVAFARRIFEEENIRKELPPINGKSPLNYDEFKDEFELQRMQRPKLMVDKEKIYAERNLEMWMSHLFTKKERQTIKRIIGDNPISRTDYEYFSRKTKKKLNAIINLQDFARAVYSKRPKYDEDLFELKRRLESWLEGYKSEKNIAIWRYLIFDSDRLAIYYHKKDAGYSGEQGFNATAQLKEIKDERIRDLLNKYPNCDFR